MAMPELALVDLERALVGTLLAHNHTVVPVASALTPNDLTDPLCCSAYTVILDLAHAGTPPNAYTVAAKLTMPVQALLDLQARSNPTLASEIMALAHTLRQDANRRRVVGIAEDILRDASRSDVDVDGLVYVAVQQLAQAVEGQSDRPADFASIGVEVEAELAVENVLPGAPTGMAWLTERTNGFRPGKFWSIIAPFKLRKSSLMRNMVISAAEAKYQVLVCALEGTREDFYLDLWAMLATRYMHRTLPPDVYQEESFLDGEHLRVSLRTPAQHSALEQTRPQMAQIGKYLRIVDARDRIIDLKRFTARVQREHFMYGTQICFIDYLQKLASTGKIYDRVSTAVMTIQDVLAPEGITAVVLSQVSDEKVKAGDTDKDYSSGAKGGNDIDAASDYSLVTEYDALKKPDILGVKLKHARRALPGQRKYDINPSSGLILGESKDQGD
jgi:replicative DNA helicase